MTSEDQHIEKKTLDDYWLHVKSACNPEDPFDLKANLEGDYGLLRKHRMKNSAKKAKKAEDINCQYSNFESPEITTISDI